MLCKLYNVMPPWKVIKNSEKGRISNGKYEAKLEFPHRLFHPSMGEYQYFLYNMMGFFLLDLKVKILLNNSISISTANHPST